MCSVTFRIFCSVLFQIIYSIYYYLSDPRLYHVSFVFLVLYCLVCHILSPVWFWFVSHVSHVYYD